jgi:Cysteine rich repeat
MFKTVCAGFAALTLLAFPAMAQRPTQAQANAIKQNCRSDYPTYCSGVPTGGSAALQCLQRNAESVSPPCRGALAALGGSGSATPPPAAAKPQAAPMSPRQEAAVLRTSCRRDYRAYCSGVEPGGGRAVACLKEHGPQLSSACRSALQSVRENQ